MPLYEYQCDTCGHRFEVIQKFSDPLADTCPKCGNPVRKLPSSPAIQFKGAGWYITDYARKGNTDGGKSSGNADSSSGGESAGESKSSGETKSSETKSDTSSSASTSTSTPSKD